jgi:hypothetical protein
MHHLRDAYRLIRSLAFHGRIDPDLHAAVADIGDLGEGCLQPDLRTGRYRCREPHLIQAIIDSHS